MIVTAGTQSKQYPSLFPAGIRIGVVTHVGQSDTALYKQIQIAPYVDFSSLDAVTALITHKRTPKAPLMPADAAKAAGLLFLVVVVQLSVMANVDILGGHPNLLLVTVVCVSLLRGAVFGAVAGFSAGLLADTGVFGTLGFTALLLTLAGYWTGPLRRDDRPRSRTRAVAVDRGHHDPVSGRRARPALHARRARAGKRHPRRAPADRVPQSDPDRSGLRAHASSVAAARAADTGGAPPWLTAFPHDASSHLTRESKSPTASRPNWRCGSACSGWWRSPSLPRSSCDSGHSRS